MPTDEIARAVAEGRAVSPAERHWTVELSCGHTPHVITFVGDFDMQAELPRTDVCFECKENGQPYVVDRVAVTAIPPEEWT